jgi:hypothetical protein
MIYTLIKRTGLLTAVFSILLTSSCATITSDIEIETHDNPSVDYNRYKTYAWAGSAQIVFDPVGQWEQPTLDTDEEVKFVINRELRGHGLTQVDHMPDLLVAYAAGIETTALELEQDPEQGKDVLMNIPKSALLVALLDAQTGYIIWLGYAEGETQLKRDMESIKARIDYAVTEIFRSYNR